MSTTAETTGRAAERAILVTGATGQQGGAVVRHLRTQGFAVRALTRDGQSPAARALAAEGVEVVQGDLDDRASLDRALAGAYGVYSVQNFALTGVEGEVRQGTTLADAAKATGIQHFVYSSVGSADRQTGIPHFESKFRIEEHIRAIDLPHTILRPVFFMENFGYARDAILGGTLAWIIHERFCRIRSTVSGCTPSDIGRPKGPQSRFWHQKWAVRVHGGPISSQSNSMNVFMNNPG